MGLPVDRWLRGPLRAMTHDLLLSGRCVSNGYLRAPALARLLREYDEGTANHDDRIWALLCLELWLRVVVEDRGVVRWGEASGSAMSLQSEGEKALAAIGAKRPGDPGGPSAEGSLASGANVRSAIGPSDVRGANGSQTGNVGEPLPERS